MRILWVLIIALVYCLLVQWDLKESDAKQELDRLRRKYD